MSRANTSEGTKCPITAAENAAFRGLWIVGAPVLTSSLVEDRRRLGRCQGGNRRHAFHDHPPQPLPVPKPASCRARRCSPLLGAYNQVMIEAGSSGPARACSRAARALGSASPGLAHSNPRSLRRDQGTDRRLHDDRRRLARRGAGLGEALAGTGCGP